MRQGSTNDHALTEKVDAMMKFVDEIGHFPKELDWHKMYESAWIDICGHPQKAKEDFTKERIAFLMRGDFQ